MAAVLKLIKSVARSERFGTSWTLASVVVAIGTLVRLPQLNNSLNEAYAFRQTQTAFVARSYLEQGIDLLRTPLPVFGADANVPMEMPLYQAVTALVAHTGIGLDLAARLVGLISFQAVAILLFVIVRRWHGARSGLISVVLLEFTPYGLHWGAASLIDFFAVAFALGMVVGLDSWFARGSRMGLVLGSLAAGIGFLAKSTSAPSWCVLLLASSATVIHRAGWAKSWRRQLVGYAAGPGVGLVAAIGWTVYGDGVKEKNHLTHFLTSDSLQKWNFGTSAQRADFHTWVTIGQRVLDEMMGAGLLAVAMALVLVFAGRDREQRWQYVAWIGAAVSGPLVFVNLYFVHDYYLITAFPAIAAVMGIGLARVTEALAVDAPRRRFVTGIALLAIAFSTAVTPAGTNSLNNFIHSGTEPALSTVMRQISTPQDRWIMLGCDWDPTFLYYADREGVMFRESTSGDFWTSEDPLTYRYVAVCSGKPDINAYLPPGHELRELPGQSALFEVVPTGK